MQEIRNKVILLIISLWLISFSLHGFNFFSPSIKQEQVFLDSSTIYTIPQNIILGSIEISDLQNQTVPSEQYTIDYNKSEISFRLKEDYYFIRYSTIPEDYYNTFSNYQEIDFADTTRINLAKRKRILFNYDPNLKISGNKTISISLANNSDFKLDQSLFLKIDGELSENLNITSQLSDSQSPITPEGDSREISNLDKVFLKLYGDQYELSFGDLEMQLPQTDFVDYAPKFEGFLTGWYPRNQVYGALAISKGERVTVTISGVEAKQGPYYLSEADSDGIKIVPGSENIFLNGDNLQRGDDYTIDYSEGSVTFSSEHFISANSQIRATFQYANEEFRQNIYLASTELSLTEKLLLKSSVVYQTDDKNNPLGISYFDNDIDSLKAGGDNLIWGDGAIIAEDGDYIFSDGYYQFVGNDTTLIGTHNIAFTEVDNGDYELADSEEYYIFVGLGNGDYLPIRKLTKPQTLGNYDIRLEYQNDLVDLYAETMLTDYDQNSWSEVDDQDNLGIGVSSGLAIKPDYDLIKPRLDLAYRHKSEELKTISETEDATTAYQLTSIPDSVRTDKISTTFGLDVIEVWKPSVSYYHTIAEDFATQDYLKIDNFFKQSGFFPQIRYQWFNNSTEYQERTLLPDNKIVQEQLDSEYLWKIFTLKGKYQSREETNKLASLENGLRNQHWQVGVASKIEQIFSSEILYKREVIDTLNSSWGNKSKIDNYVLDSFYRRDKSQAKINFSHRQVHTDSTQNYNMANFSGRTSLLKSSIDLNSNYSLQNLQFYPKIKELEFVGEELGIYDSLGVANEDGTYDYVIKSIDYDNPRMSIEVNADFTVNLKPQIITNTYWERFKYEHYYAVTENSQSSYRKKVYLLANSATMNDSTTIYGRRSSRQTLWYNLIKKKLFFKLKLDNINILDNRYQEQETNRVDEVEYSLNFMMIKNSSIKMEYIARDEDNSRFGSESDQDSYAVDLRKKITKNLTIHTKLAYTDETGEESNVSYQNRIIESNSDLTWFWNRKYRVVGKFDYKRNKREGAQSNAYLDRNNGNAFDWNIFINYRINDFTFAALKYLGEKNPDQETVHKITMEVKAEF